MQNTLQAANSKAVTILGFNGYPGQSGLGVNVGYRLISPLILHAGFGLTTMDHKYHSTTEDYYSYGAGATLVLIPGFFISPAATASVARMMTSGWKNNGTEPYFAIGARVEFTQNKKLYFYELGMGALGRQIRDANNPSTDGGPQLYFMGGITF